MIVVTVLSLLSPVNAQGLNTDAFDKAMDELRQPRYTEVVMEVSAYTASTNECGKGDGVTASGVRAVEGLTVASDDLPFGTVVVIQGKSYVVQDRFGGGYTDRLDIYFESMDAAEDFGRQRITVRIKE